MGGGLYQVLVDTHPEDDLDITLPSASNSSSIGFANTEMAKNWECLNKEKWIHNSCDRVVFVPTPSEEEIEEATKHLHAAFSDSKEHKSSDNLDMTLPSTSNTSLVGFTDKCRDGQGSEMSKQRKVDSNSRDLLLFASTTSEEEVEEATKHLHAALFDSKEFKSSDKKRELVPFVVGNEERSADNALASNMVLKGHNSTVYEALRIMQTNPKVQDAVKSLACDPTFWEAVMSNQKVQELTRGLQATDLLSGVHRSSRWGHTDLPGQNYSFHHKDERSGFNITEFASKLCDFVTGTVMQALDRVFMVVNSVFTSMEKTFVPAEGTNNIDKTLASSVMLAIAVILVVMVRRHV